MIGASAGGVEVLVRFVSGLPVNLPAAFFVVLHTKPGGTGLLPRILQRHTDMPVTLPENNAPIRHGRIYVAPPDRHLILAPERVKLTLGPTHNRNRPAIDPLFSSAAQHFGPRVVGIIMTGFLDDGAEGLADIQNRGGYTIVQSPQEALVPSMPQHALLRMKPNAVVPVDEMPQLIARVCSENVKAPVAAHPEGSGGAAMKPTTLTCPECHGVISQHLEGMDVRFQCQVGHSFTPNGFLDAQNDDLERALWAAVRSLEEGATLSRKLAELSAVNDRKHATKLYKNNAATREQHARTLRSILEMWERHDRDPELLETETP